MSTETGSSLPRAMLMALAAPERQTVATAVGASGLAGLAIFLQREMQPGPFATSRPPPGNLRKWGRIGDRRSGALISAVSEKRRRRSSPPCPS
jgi:hypothetical protein